MAIERWVRPKLASESGEGSYTCVYPWCHKPVRHDHQSDHNKHVNSKELGESVMTHMHLHTGQDRRARLCGRCYSWFLTDGVRSRFCESCRLESGYALALPWLAQQDDAREVDAEAVTTGSASTR